MPQGKQAKALTEGQVRAALSYLEKSRYPKRDKVLFLLSVKAGLRAKEISSITWSMVTDGEGNLSDCISLDNRATKGKSGRTIPLNKTLKEALAELKEKANPEQCDYIITSERRGRLTPNSIVMWFNRLFDKEHLNLEGCSSHSGRRTFITNAAKKVSVAGGSLRDVQELAGHSSLQTTQRYVEGDTEAKRRLVNLI